MNVLDTMVQGSLNGHSMQVVLHAVQPSVNGITNSGESWVLTCIKCTKAVMLTGSRDVVGNVDFYTPCQPLTVSMTPPVNPPTYFTIATPLAPPPQYSVALGTPTKQEIFDRMKKDAQDILNFVNAGDTVYYEYYCNIASSRIGLSPGPMELSTSNNEGFYLVIPPPSHSTLTLQDIHNAIENEAKPYPKHFMQNP